MFPCTKCGLCCQNITNIKELEEYDLGNGVCKNYDRMTKYCGIYNTRPDICKVDTMFNLVYCKEFTMNEFYIGNAQVCNSLQEQNKVDKSFRVIIKKGE